MEVKLTVKERRFIHGKLKELETRVKRIEDQLNRAKVVGDKLSCEKTTTLVEAGLKRG